uniref:DDE_3 domain-containing protein n=1 Tax=Heterorhabditis bacteriophora TaxID=37862 RepID=A0A1I7XRE0_HETBA
MGRAFLLSLHERDLIKALSTAGYMVKRSADAVKRYRKAIMNFLRHQEEYGTKKSSGQPSMLNDREKGKFCRQPLREWSNWRDDEDEQHGQPGCLRTLSGSQDNATIHASQSTKTRLEYNDVTLDWPSRSPDLNPMENLWAILVCRIHGDKRQFETTKYSKSALAKHGTK